MRTELHHHHHQVPTCGIKHKVPHRTHLKKKVKSRFISEILPYCVQNTLVSSDHPTSFCVAATQLWKDNSRSLFVFQGCHYSPSLHLPKRHISNFNREKTIVFNAEYLYFTIQNKTQILHPLSISCGIFATNPILSNIYIPKGLHRYVYIFLLFYLVYKLYLIDFSSESPPCILFCNK